MMQISYTRFTHICRAIDLYEFFLQPFFCTTQYPWTHLMFIQIILHLRGKPSGDSEILPGNVET